MNKIPKLLLTILTIYLIGAPFRPVSAAMKDKGTTWWSVEEMIAFYQEVEVEKEAECGSNQDCRMEFDFNLFEKGEKYQALHNFTEGQVWLTSINPGEEIIKVFYFDDEMMLRHMGIEEKISLEHLYFGWVEDWHGQIFSYDHDYFNNGDLPGNHPMYDGSAEKDGEGWLPAWEEVELSVAGSNLVDNTHGRIDYAVYAERNMFNAQGSFDYSNCLRSPDYEVGMECKMYVSADQWVAFFPPREDIVEESEVEPEQDEQGKSEEDSGAELIEEPEEEQVDSSEEPEQEESEQEPVQEEPTQGETDQEEAQEEPTQEETQDEPTQDESGQEQPNQEEIKKEPIRDESTQNEQEKPVQEELPEEKHIQEEAVQETSVHKTIEQKEPVGQEGSEQQTATKNLVNTSTPLQLAEDKAIEPNTLVDLTTNLPPTSSNTPDIVKAPDTGTAINLKEGNYEEYLTPLIIFGALFIIWWFLPTRSTKAQKKYKKSIDKKYKLR